jgi:hypothetical protein
MQLCHKHWKKHPTSCAFTCRNDLLLAIYPPFRIYLYSEKWIYCHSMQVFFIKLQCEQEQCTWYPILHHVFSSWHIKLGCIICRCHHRSHCCRHHHCCCYEGVGCLWNYGCQQAHCPPIRWYEWLQSTGGMTLTGKPKDLEKNLSQWLFCPPEVPKGESMLGKNCSSILTDIVSSSLS